MQDIELFEKALRSEKPVEQLCEVAQQLATQGHSPLTIYQRFQEKHIQLQMQQRLADEDVILEVMDYIIGWCNPENNLFPDYHWSNESTP